MTDWDFSELLTLSPRFLRRTPEPPSSPATEPETACDPIPFPISGHHDDDHENPSDTLPSSDDVPLAEQRAAGVIESASSPGEEEADSSPLWSARPRPFPQTPVRQTVTTAELVAEPPDTETQFSSPWRANEHETAAEVRKRKTIQKAQANRVATLAAQAAARDRAREVHLQATAQENQEREIQARQAGSISKGPNLLVDLDRLSTT